MGPFNPQIIQAHITRKYYGPADISVKERGTTPIFLHKTIFLNGQCVYCVHLQMGNKKMNPFKNKNIRIKFYLFFRTHAFEHHQYIVEFYITKLSVQCSLPMWVYIRKNLVVLHALIFGCPNHQPAT